MQNNEPTIDIIIPTLGRPNGLERLLKSIEALNYPKDKITIKVMDDNETRLGVPKILKLGVSETNSEYIIYAANDTEFHPDALFFAIGEILETGFLAFNTGDIYPDEGNICEHFMIKRDLIDQINGEIFDTDLYHVGTDNLLWAKMKKLKKAKRSILAVMYHYHFSKGYDFDDIYKIAWNEDRVKHDRDLLKIKLKELEK